MKQPIDLTKAAVQKVLDVMVEEGLDNHALRVGVQGGGCSGLQYILDFTEGPAGEQDIEHDINGLRVVVDCFSASHLYGTQIDYVDGLMNSGFQFNNPNAVRKCGCSMSFSTG